jgi:hypothetical protein
MVARERLDPSVFKPRPRPRPENRLTLLDALDDAKLFAPFFPDLDSWLAWRSFIAAAFGLPMNKAQLAIYKDCTGRTDVPTQQFKEIVLTCGRRAGKSRNLALIAVWLACFHNYKQFLAEGELGVVMVLAADKLQARVILGYVKGFISKIPMLKRLVERETQFGVELSNSVAIEITTSNFKAVRGRAIIAALCDEIAFWSDEESSNPDAEVIKAIRPGMAMIPNSMLLLASSPYARKGVLYTQHKKYHGQNDPRVLSWQAATDVMNPRVDPEVIAQAYQDDPVSASAEYGAQFRSDIEAFVTREAIDAVVTDGERERPYIAGTPYLAFTDPAGGSGKDSFTLAIGHIAKGVAVVDVVREHKPPFSPKAVVEEYAELLKHYNVRKLQGDRYAGLWPVEAFHQHKITYEQSAKAKSEIYGAFLPLLNSRKIDLLDDEKTINQLLGLERRTARSGRDSIDHAPNSHDDKINSVAGLCVLLAAPKRYRYDASMDWVGLMTGGNSTQSTSAQMLSSLVQVQTMKGLLK